MTKYNIDVRVTGTIEVVDVVVEPQPPEPPVEPPIEPEPQPSSKEEVLARSIGINLATATYWSPAWVFSDVFKNSHSSWFGDTSVLGGKDYPPYAPPAINTLCAHHDVNGHYPAGEYTLWYDGQGVVTVNGSRYSSGDSIPIVPTNGAIRVDIRESSADDPVRNIRLLMPEEYRTDGDFTKQYLEYVSPYSVLRFMDWGKTNNSPLVSWNMRNTVDRRTQYAGMAYEHMIAFANETNKHMWICMPHMADDNFIAQLAELIRTTLNPNLYVFLEYSNEVWNSMFQQNKWIREYGLNTGIMDPSKPYYWYPAYAERSSNVFNIFEDVFGSADRLIRVISGQTANPWIGKQIIMAMNRPFDAFAIAPYFGGHLDRDTNVPNMTVEEIIASCHENMYGAVTQKIHEHMALLGGTAKLLAYEGGQHLVHAGENFNVPEVSEKFIAANRHGGMYQLYFEYLSQIWPADAGPLCLFNDMMKPTKHGSWGLSEHHGFSGPKINAVLDYIRAST